MAPGDSYPYTRPTRKIQIILRDAMSSGTGIKRQITK